MNNHGGPMAQHRNTALVVENDAMQRMLVSMMLEQGDMDVIACESAEDAVHVLDQTDASVCLVFTNVELGGIMDGIELAAIARLRFPNLHVVLTSGTPRGRRLPDGTTFLAKPWSPVELLREAEKSIH